MRALSGTRLFHVVCGLEPKSQVVNHWVVSWGTSFNALKSEKKFAVGLSESFSC